MSDSETPLNEDQHQTARSVGPVPPTGNVPAEGTIAPAEEVVYDDLEEVSQPEPETGDDEESVLVQRAIDARDSKDRSHPDDPSGLSLESVAESVMRGNWGTGQERRLRLEEAGYDHVEVTNEVNRLRREAFNPQ